MLGPGWDQGCPSCSFLADHFDGATIHLAHRDVTFTAVSRAPYPEIAAFRRRMGWRFSWVSSFGGDFNRDFHVSFSPDEIARGPVDYNYELTTFPGEEAPGLSVFARNAAGEVFHTYSTYARGLDMLAGTYNFLDLVPKGRDEDGLAFTMSWVRHHDRYHNGYVVRAEDLYQKPQTRGDCCAEAIFSAESSADARADSASLHPRARRQA